MPDVRKLAETSEEHLRLVLSVGQIGVWELDLATGTAWRNDRHDEIFGYGPELETWTYDQFLDHIVPEHRERVHRLQQKAIASREQWVFDCQIERTDGERRWISASGRPTMDAHDKVAKLIGHVIDITETKANEDRLQILANELRHRVRNLLAMIRAIIVLSARRATDVATFASSLEGRIGAIARTYDMMELDEQQTLSPTHILELEMGGFNEFWERTTLSGESRLGLRGPRAEAFSLVIHELVTNAIKFGALSNEAGRVDIKLQDQPGNTVSVIWSESGGPPPTPSARQGFGTRMIANVLSGQGKLDMDFRPEGLVCTMELYHCAPIDG